MIVTCEARAPRVPELEESPETRVIVLRGWLRYALDSRHDPELTPVDLTVVVREIAEQLPELEPGLEFAALLLELGSTAIDDCFVCEAILTGWDRQRGWTQAQFYAAAEPFTEKDHPSADAESGGRSEEWSNTESLRMALGVSRYGARNVALITRRLFAIFPDTLEQLRRGQISQGHVWALIETTRDLDDEDAGKVEQLTFRDAPEQTIAEYRRALDRARLVVSPRKAEQRNEAVVAARGVSKWTDRDGNAKLLANLPAEDMAAAWDALVAKANADRQADDPRGLGARLADALVESLTGFPAAHDPRRRPDTPATDDNPLDDDPAPAPKASTPLGHVEVHVVVPRRQITGEAATGELVLPFANRAARRAGGRRGRVLTSQSVTIVGLETFMGGRCSPPS